MSHRASRSSQPFCRAARIYCNNNFTDAEGPFPSKLPSASLNLSTYIALYNYGYRNVYELAHTFELKASKLGFEAGARQ